MGSAAKRLISVLQAQADLAWFRLVGHPPDHDNPVPPLVVWRYKAQQPALEAALADAVSGFQGRVTWIYELQGRNWVLMPARVAEIQRARALATDSAALRALSEEDPVFCRAAEGDLTDLIDRLEAVLAKEN